MDVFCPFRVYVPQGESKFELDIPKKYVSDRNLRFYFDHLKLVPEFYSQQAAALNLDPSESVQKVSNQASMEVKLTEDIYSEAGRYEQPRNQMPLNHLIQSVNEHFEGQQPPGLWHQAFFIDWIDARALRQGPPEKQQDYYQAMSYQFYLSSHPPELNTLPTSLGDVAGINKLPFPTRLVSAAGKGDLDQSVMVVDSTLEEEEFQEAQEDLMEDESILRMNVRVRIHVMPNTTVSFNNPNILKALGFDETQYGKRGGKNRFHLVNATANKMLVLAARRPSEPAIEEGMRTNFIYLSSTYAGVILPTVPIDTTRERENNPVLLAEDYNKGFRLLAGIANYRLGFEYDPVQRKFLFVFPPNDKLQVVVKIPSHLSRQLGYGNKERITAKDVPDPVDTTLDVTDNERRSRALVFDTGLVAVAHEHEGSVQTVGLVNEFVAALFPEYSGVLTAKSVNHPGMVVSQFGSFFKFCLYRFSEENKAAALDWPCGSFIEGVLHGQV